MMLEIEAETEGGDVVAFAVLVGRDIGIPAGGGAAFDEEPVMAVIKTDQGLCVYCHACDAGGGEERVTKRRRESHYRVV